MAVAAESPVWGMADTLSGGSRGAEANLWWCKEVTTDDEEEKAELDSSRSVEHNRKKDKLVEERIVFVRIIVRECVGVALSTVYRKGSRIDWLQNNCDGFP